MTIRVTDAQLTESRAAEMTFDWAAEIGLAVGRPVNISSECSGQPSGMESTPFIAAHRNNSLLFRTGADPQQRQLVVVKARVNRGFAFHAYIPVETSWMYNPTFAAAPLDDAIATAADLSSTFAAAVAVFAPAGSVVGLARSSALVRMSRPSGAAGPRVLTLQPPDLLGLLVSLLSRLIGTEVELIADGS